MNAALGSLQLGDNQAAQPPVQEKLVIPPGYGAQPAIAP